MGQSDEDVPFPVDLDHWELTDTRSGVRVRLEDVGYGVGQLLPIIDYCTRDGNQVICIEQPELHLHPRLQGNLGDLFVDSVARGNQVIAETHSENILLRVQRLVRQRRLAPEQVRVLYVDNTPDEGATVRRLDLGTDGDLLSPWPTGFFDDRLDDILGILE
jgi:predicted ATPase